MKKNKRHLYKRLPKYALGTMKPIDLGYLPGRGIGSAKFLTEQNVSLEPETQAIRKSALPNALGYVTLQTPYITESLKSYNLALLSAVPQNLSFLKFSNNIADRAKNTFNLSVTNVGSSMYNTTGSATTNAWQGVPYQLPQQTQSYLYNGWGNALGNAGGSALSNTGSFSAGIKGIVSGAKSAMKAAVLNVGGLIAKEGAKRAGTSTLGAAMGAVGTALGAYTMANQIADFGSHRSASDMMANVGRAHNTTEYGNQYTTYNGVNTGQELAYERANARAKQLGFGMNSIGTGASLGGMLGSLGALGSIGGPLGTALGAGVGLLLGGLGSLFGWGDNSEEIERITKLTNDNLAMYNREQEAVARSKDVAAEFNDRLSVGSAAGGKSAYGPMGVTKKYSVGKSYAIGPHGLSNKVGSLVEGLETIWDTNPNNPEGVVVPGKPKGDVIPSSTTPYNADIVISNQNPFNEKARNIVKQQDWLNDVIAKAGGSKLQQELLIREAEKMKQINNEKMKIISMFNPANLKYNKFREGKPYANVEDYLFNQEDTNRYNFGLSGALKGLAMATPHMWGFLQNAANYRRDKYANVRSYNPYVEDPLSERAINDLHRIRFDARPYYNEARKLLNYANFNTGRNVGLGAGGMEIAKNANFLGYLDKMKDINALANEFNAKHATTAAQLEALVGQTNQARQIAGNTSWYQWLREAMAAKHANLRTDQLNMYKTFGQGVEDFAKSVYADRAAKMNERMMGMYGQLLTNDKIKLLHDLNLWNPTQTIPSLPKKSETELDENTLRYLREELAKQQLLKYGGS